MDNNIFDVFRHKTSLKNAKSASQQVSKSASQQVSKSASQQVSKSASQQVSKSASQQVSKSASQQLSKSASQQVSKSAWLDIVVSCKLQLISHADKTQPISGEVKSGRIFLPPPVTPEPSASSAYGTYLSVALFFNLEGSVDVSLQKQFQQHSCMSTSQGN